MDSVSTTSTTSTAAAKNSASKAVTATAVTSDFETFLKMLSVQLQNQDPLNPVDSSDYAVQLATFSSVEQQVLTNDLLQSLAGKFVASGMADLANWVGMEALSTASAAFDGTPVTLHADAQFGADRRVLGVRDENGALVASIEIPAAGERYVWDGTDGAGKTLSGGRYSFEIESYGDGELLGTELALSYSRIVEARVVNGETVLQTTSGDTILAEDVAGLRHPG